MGLRIEEALLRRMWPNGDQKIPGLVAGIAKSSEAVLRKWGITTPLQLAHIMAQLSHECGAGRDVIESLYYTTPAQMMKTWPRRFPTTASTVPYLRNERKLANKVYNGRMGNREGSDDGYNFRGRGGSQTTGREGYERLGRRFGLDLVGHPDWLNDPDRFFDFAVGDFVLCGCLPFTAPKPSLPLGDLPGVTFKLNGGHNGEADRRQWFARWWPVLRGLQSEPAPASPVAAPADLRAPDPDTAPEPAPAPELTDEPDDGILRYGVGHDRPDPRVLALQQLLVSKGYMLGAVDGEFGGGTRAAVLAAQADNGLPTNGEVDGKVWTEFRDMPEKPISEARANATANDLAARGSTVIKDGKHVGLVGKVLAFFGIGGAADQSGLLDRAKGALDQVYGLRSVVDKFGDVLTWAASHWWIWAGVAGFAVWVLANRVIARRLADHRNASNLNL
jgi:putative chitinase